MKREFACKELLFYLAVFLISCMNSALNYVFLALVFFLIRQGSQGYLKMCFLLTMRQSFYIQGFTSRMTGGQINIKLVIMAVGGVIVILGYLQRNRNKIPSIVSSVVWFGFFALFSAAVFGSYPVAGSIKVINFSLVLVAIILAAVESSEFFDLQSYVYYVMSAFMIISFFLLFYSGAYVNGSAGLLFKGAWDHPNDFGVICAIYLAIVLVRCKRIQLFQVAQLVMSLVMIFLSNSRGSMIASMGIILCYFVLCKNKTDRVIIGVATIFLIAAMFIGFNNLLLKFFAKGSGKLSFDSFNSRSQIMELALVRYRSNRLFGRGLLITYESGFRSLIFDEKGTEPGNILYELLAGTGIVGVVAFMNMLRSFFEYSKDKYRIYVIAAVLASISEVSFFSVNNYASIYYIILALCVVAANRDLTEYNEVKMHE